jgi:hypothetical protein
MGNLLKNEASPCYGPDQKCSLDLWWTSLGGEHPTLKPRDSHHCWWNLHLSLHGHQWKSCEEHRTSQEGKFTGTQQQPTKVTGNRSQCGSTTIRELHLQPRHGLDYIWTKPCAWCIVTVCKFCDLERWEQCKCEWGEAGQGSVQSNSKDLDL